MGLFSKSESKSDPGSGKVIALLNQKGGVGKTTMAFNLAHGLKKRGHRVLCLDMDPQSNLSYLFGFEDVEGERATLFDLLINSVRELKSLHRPVILDEVLCEDKSGVHYLPAGQGLSGFELSVAGIQSPRQMILKKFIESQRFLHRYDYVVIDSPPTLGLLVVNILVAAHGVLIPFRPDGFSRKGLEHFYEVLEDVEDMGVSEVPTVLAHIPNLVDNRRKQEEEDLNLISEQIRGEWESGEVIEPFYNRSPLVRAQAQRRSVYDYSAKEFVGLQERFNQLVDKIEEWR